MDCSAVECHPGALVVVETFSSPLVSEVVLEAHDLHVPAVRQGRRRFVRQAAQDGQF